jgi:hypothetical protein
MADTKYKDYLAVQIIAENKPVSLVHTPKRLSEN